MFGIPRNGIFFHFINFRLRHIDKARGGKFENLSSRCNQLAGGDYRGLYNNQINARALIDQSAMVYCVINPWKKRAASELLYKSNRPQVSMVNRLINHLGCW